MKQVPVSGGLFALVDDADFELVSGYKWNITRRKRPTQYAQCKIIHDLSGERMTVTMHRMILGYPERQIDHRDTNGLNNQRDNLRLATQIENSRNRKLQKHSSRFKGVSFSKPTNRWHAYIRINTVLKHLGFFIVETDAAEAYDAAAEKYFGEFARTNYSMNLL